MTGPAGLAPLAPLLVLAAGALVVTLAVALRRHHGAAAALTAVTFASAAVSTCTGSGRLPVDVGPLFHVTSFGLTIVAILALAGLAVTGLAHGYLRSEAGRQEEVYIVLLLAALGAGALVLAGHFASLFLGLETLGVGLYVLVASLRERRRCLEAGMKYLVLTGTASAFLAFGGALLFWERGGLELSGLAAGTATPIGRAALLLLAAGLAFKLALPPFHLWTADVYQGAPAPVTGFLATVSKGAVVGLVVGQLGAARESLALPLAVMAGAAMVVGTLLALLQDNLKRLLAFSSIGHLGYLLVAYLAGGARGTTAAGFYLAAYAVSVLAAFGAVGALSRPGEEREEIAAWRGMAWRRPGIAALLALALLSLAGIPLTAGFLAKLWVVTAGLDAALTTLVLLLVLTSAAAVYYYLRVVLILFDPSGEEEAEPGVPLAWSTRATLLLLAAAVVALGVAPGGLLAALGT